jgi:uncharacterized protein YcaQ
MGAVTLDHLRRYAVARSLFRPTTLPRALARLGFVQADPIRAPARAQDLTLRHRVAGYRAGDLERRYAELELEEAFFVNYGFLQRADYLRMHPRGARQPWDQATRRRARAVLRFVRERGSAHPREVEARFSHGKAVNYWGGTSNAATQLLDAMHYGGLLRVLKRESGVRVYAAQARPEASGGAARHIDALVDIIVRKYAPLPAASLANLIGRLRHGAPHWADRMRPALRRARKRLAHARIDGVDWYWPGDEDPASSRHDAVETVRLLSPFDPVVWDRRRFELLWGWPYRFEAYTPAAKRKLGYYALPLLWRDRVIGWSNASRSSNGLDCRHGFVAGTPRGTAFRRELDAELARLQAFLEPER